jgi:archaeal type IV pilus assembly protein PilA
MLNKKNCTVLCPTWALRRVLQTMVVTRKNEEAVSPVIGVILMVAITVILAAVIAAFVFGMSGNINKTKVVAVTVQQPSSDKIVVTYNGGQDSGSLTTIHVVINDGATTVNWLPTTMVGGWFNGTAPATGTLAVGSSISANAAVGAFTPRDHVVAIGFFSDNSQQVLLDTYV